MAAPAFHWLAAFPKSGSTWMQALLANVLAPGPDPVPLSQLERGISANPGAFEDLCWLEPGMLRRAEIDLLRPGLHAAQQRETPLRFAKIHDCWRLLPDGRPLVDPADALGVIYVLRDPRDVAVSVARFIDVGLDAAVDIVLGEREWYADRPIRPAFVLPFPLGGWAHHVASWTEQTTLPLHAVRYEDLLGDPRRAFARVVAFAGLDRSDQEVERAVRNADFRVLRALEQRDGFRQRVSATNLFFRQGRAGGWREVLSPVQSKRIETACAAMLEKWNYL